MATNRSNYDYEEIIKNFGREKLIKRYNTLRQYMEQYIQRTEYSGKVQIADSVLNQAVIDYFADIDRLKNFHKIDKINFTKIHAYTAYWLLRRKPLQIVEDDDENMELPFVNENFVASYLLQFMRGEDRNVVIRSEDRWEYDGFVKNLNYVLRYRTITAQMLETILESYKAGRIFEKSIV
ncbi:hypothetical protein [Eubacterium sp. ER2]|uniref:hypothetical protein n=1 Tax=Eubacterium sp. ER2 TaxID=1519438 RepID=UPI00051C0090|nr:hypothetical protein [Eubacterium sp. ER2]